MPHLNINYRQRETLTIKELKPKAKGHVGLCASANVYLCGRKNTEWTCSLFSDESQVSSVHTVFSISVHISANVSTHRLHPGERTKPHLLYEHESSCEAQTLSCVIYMPL